MDDGVLPHGVDLQRQSQAQAGGALDHPKVGDEVDPRLQVGAAAALAARGPRVAAQHGERGGHVDRRDKKLFGEHNSGTKTITHSVQLPPFCNLLFF